MSNIVLAITGGIAAYKSAALARLLVKKGHSVRVVMTAGACAFITPLTFQALTGNEVHTDLLDETAEKAMGHIELAKWADMVVIAPASANTIGKLANGLADNLLTAVCLATTAPILLAPAMNQAMWHNLIVQDNLAKLSRFNFSIIPPDSGEQACGDVGAGRLPEPEVLCRHLDEFLAVKDTAENTALTLAKKTVVISAGATVEPIDPVRFLSNHSTGKMGYALAQACLNAGAKVILVAGSSVTLPTPLGVEKHTIGTADELLKVCLQVCQKADIFIATAAVADFRVQHIAPQKLKKTADHDGLTLKLIKNPDVLATIASTYPHLLTVGFAAETTDVQNYAKAKLVAKNLDMIAVNDVSDKRIGFGSDDNAMTVFFAERYGVSPYSIAKTSKAQVAKQLVAQIGKILSE